MEASGIITTGFCCEFSVVVSDCEIKQNISFDKDVTLHFSELCLFPLFLKKNKLRSDIQEMPDQGIIDSLLMAIWYLWVVLLILNYSVISVCLEIFGDTEISWTTNCSVKAG